MFGGGYVGKIWLNGEFGLSREKGVRLDRTVQRTSPEEKRWNSTMLRIHGLEACLEHRGFSLSNLMEGVCDSDHNGFVARERDGAVAIGSSLVAKSQPSPRGANGISRYGAKLVRNGAYLMEKERTLTNLSFLTVTLPNVSQEEAIRCSENWAEIVRQFVQWLRKTLRKARLPGEIIGCTEVQEKRVALTGVFGLHLHFVFVGRRRRAGWALRPTEIREAWKRAIAPYLDSPIGGYDWRACERVESLRKSASGYLGKYMSKGLKACQKLRAMFPGVKFPSCWYVCTNSLRRRVKSGVLRVSGDMGRVLADLVESRDDEFVAYVSPVKVNWADIQLTIGYTGRLTGRAVKELTVWIKDDRGEPGMPSLIIGNSNLKGV